MASRQQPIYTPDEYLERERQAETKHEYLDGRIYAMSGASRNHNRIMVAVVGELRTQLRGRPCEVSSSDMRVRVPNTGLYTYPDVSALCGDARFDDKEDDTLLNPSMLAEVLSKSTESYDRGDKFAHYRKIASLREYVLFAQDRVYAERFTRDGAGGDTSDTWSLAVFEGPEALLTLPSIDCVLQLRDVYERVELPPDVPLRAVYEAVPATSYR